MRNIGPTKIKTDKSANDNNKRNKTLIQINELHKYGNAKNTNKKIGENNRIITIVFDINRFMKIFVSKFMITINKARIEVMINEVHFHM